MEGTALGLKQKWYCSQVEDDFQEGHAMDWLEDDEMMKQWEDVSNEEEKITVRKMEGKRLQVEGVQKVPELLALRQKSVSRIPRRRSVD